MFHHIIYHLFWQGFEPDLRIMKITEQYSKEVWAQETAYYSSLNSLLLL